jgi:hypothetical protein
MTVVGGGRSRMTADAVAALRIARYWWPCHKKTGIRQPVFDFAPKQLKPLYKINPAAIGRMVFCGIVDNTSCQRSLAA